MYTNICHYINIRVYLNTYTISRRVNPFMEPSIKILLQYYLKCKLNGLTQYSLLYFINYNLISEKFIIYYFHNTCKYNSLMTLGVSYFFYISCGLNIIFNINLITLNIFTSIFIYIYIS